MIKSYAKKLRPYQRDALKELRRRMRSDKDHVHVLSLPTGAGKTLVAIVLLLTFLEKQPTGRVIWVTHRWDLLAQAWQKLKELNAQYAAYAGRLGGLNGPLQEVPERPHSRILFTTIQTWHSRKGNGDLPNISNECPVLLIIDEVHWAAGATLGRALLDEHLGHASIIGLSATPNVSLEQYRRTYTKTFAELCPEYLAMPHVREVETGITWNPIFEAGQITPSSLSRLGNRHKRNEKIVREYLDGHASGRYIRTLIFACDIKHANKLNQMLSRRGVACRAVHSKHSLKANQRAIAEFRKGAVDVLVTVGMLTEGFDVPEIDTVFLARPTESLTLLSQMTGRGARKCNGKKSFSLVEFTDSVGRLGSDLFHAREYVTPSSARTRHAFVTAPLRHEEPKDIPQFERLHISGLESVTFARGQTFGVEIELGSPRGRVWYGRAEWQDTANRIIARLNEVALLPVYPRPLDYHENNDVTKWRVCYDASCGWEIVSPILVDAIGFEELACVSKGLSQLVEDDPKLCVNRRTGLHITLATRLDTQRRQKGFAARLTRLEPGLYTLVAPSRLYQCCGNWNYNRRGRNRYCQPLSELPPLSWGLPFRRLAEQANRFRSVNLLKARRGTRLLEVRMHHGTTNCCKIIPWIALWMHIFNRSRYDWRGEPRIGRVLPNGNSRVSRNRVYEEDIFRLLKEEGIILPAGFEALLHNRRAELRPAWNRAVPNRVSRWADIGWYQNTGPTSHVGSEVL